MADQISDAVLDAIIADDPHSRVAVETMVKTGMAIIAGEVRTKTYVDLEQLFVMSLLTLVMTIQTKVLTEFLCCNQRHWQAIIGYRPRS